VKSGTYHNQGEALMDMCSLMSAGLAEEVDKGQPLNRWRLTEKGKRGRVYGLDAVDALRAIPNDRQFAAGSHRR
jgi:hypothetical protein